MRISKLLCQSMTPRNSPPPREGSTSLSVFAAQTVGDTAFAAGLGYECVSEGLEGALWSGMLGFSTGVTVGQVAADYFELEGARQSATVWVAGAACGALGAAFGAYGRAWEGAALAGSGALATALYWDFPTERSPA